MAAKVGAASANSSGLQPRQVKRDPGAFSSHGIGLRVAVRPRWQLQPGHPGPALCLKRHGQFVALALWLLKLQPPHLCPGARPGEASDGPFGEHGAASRLSPGGWRGRTAERRLGLAPGPRGW